MSTSGRLLAIEAARHTSALGECGKLPPAAATWSSIDPQFACLLQWIDLPGLESFYGTFHLILLY